MKTNVIYRLDGNEVVAVFPNIPQGRGTVQIYAHLGQHGAGCLAWYRSTRPAHPDQYAALHRELESLGYDLAIRTRAHRWGSEL